VPRLCASLWALAARVMHNVQRVCDDRGLLVITHDITTLEDFDRVLSL
jgi:ABC-type transport system involved in cytochrome bd biosynthesis fused ATPase/permease subunit